MKNWFALPLLLLSVMALSGCSGFWSKSNDDKPIGTKSIDTQLTNLNALFVGVDTYQFSRTNLRSSEFEDLQGAVGDVLRFKDAFREIYAVEFDRSGDGNCETSNHLSTTLINSCATRARIMDELDARIAALSPGDTLLFYFAGHGSQYQDDENYDQDTGYNGTILPYDARNPNGSAGEIFDIELKQIKDRATAAGIYFVSIFDSCNSATATRDGANGQSRSVPPLSGGPPQDQASRPPVAGSGDGYWVHLAAAQDGEEAQETVNGSIGRRAGVFTSALIETLRMPAMRHATFGDIIAEVQLRVSRNGHSSQTPSAEGELTAAWGARARSTILFEAENRDGEVQLLAGSLSGMTVGSAFAFYATQQDAVDRNAQLATGQIIELGPNSARVRITPGSSDKLPEKIYAEETAHFFAPDILKISNQIPANDGGDRVQLAITAMNFVDITRAGTIHIVGSEEIPGHARLQANDGTKIADLGEIEDAGFPARLEAELKKIARVDQLLALRTTSPTRQAQTHFGAVDFCIAAEGYRPSSCPSLENGGVRHIDLKEKTIATVINRGDRPAFIYLLAIDPKNGVVLVLPRPGEIDQKIEPNRPYRRGPISFQVPGPYRFITIASEERIRVDAFQQSGSGIRNIDICSSPLEKLLCSASQGTRDPEVSEIGNWSAVVASAVVN
ncbi:Caspase domain-containing protein [Parasphingorhabdus marina DSM 22363]|uniref:Caspase domain-containing protein n=1 Tax=Parasphingorhabdus marina DSM 22363 TaxID=1123272 RepID=A0A1N6D2E3_9SPHN|nr:caspase family protein [Parasphingorhabdus marina]SIN64968.1 Caspase domain-containing protein [Parasphingorhabdus marina DSM 22363]